MRVPSSVIHAENLSELKLSGNPDMYRIEQVSGRNLNIIINSVENYDVWLIARQSKSRHPALWTYQSLAQSNANLIELSPHRANDCFSYVLPVGGVKDGLCDKAIFIC